MESKIKILSVNTSDVSGGAARAAYRIHTAVDQLGVDSRMLVKNKLLADDKVLSVSQFDQPNFFKNSFRFVQKKIKNKLQHYQWNKYPQKEDVFLSDLRSESIHGAFQKIDFDILHLHWINQRFLDLKELLKINKPIVWTLHDSWAFTGICHYAYYCDKFKSECGACPFLHSSDKNDLSHQVWEKKHQIYTKLNLHIVTPSKWLAELVRHSSLMQNFSVTVIPNCLDVNIFKPVTKTEALSYLNLNAGKKRILYGAVNALKDVNKGFRELIDAIDYLNKKIDCDQFELLVFGADNPTAKIETPMHIHYLGVIKSDFDLVNIYNSADVMVVPSRWEVFGQTASEAMACGTPVVAFDCTGIKEVVDHKKAGYLAKPYDSEDLANGIQWCLENNEDGYLSDNARKKVEENYSVEIVAKMYIELYKSLI